MKRSLLVLAAVAFVWTLLPAGAAAQCAPASPASNAVAFDLPKVPSDLAFLNGLAKDIPEPVLLAEAHGWTEEECCDWIEYNCHFYCHPGTVRGYTCSVVLGTCQGGCDCEF